MGHGIFLLGAGSFRNVSHHALVFVLRLKPGTDKFISETRKWLYSLFCAQCSEVRGALINSASFSCDRFFTSGGLIAHFDTLARHFNRGVKAARAQGLYIFPITFSRIIGDLCGTSATVAEAAGCPMPFQCVPEVRCSPLLKNSLVLGGAKRNLTELTCPQVGHTTTSGTHGNALVDRIGPEAAPAVERQLNGTAYAWMLDMHASQWPAGTPRPVELIL